MKKQLISFLCDKYLTFDNQVLKKRLGNDVKKLEKLLGLFIIDLEALNVSLSSAYAEQDWETIKVLIGAPAKNCQKPVKSEITNITYTIPNFLLNKLSQESSNNG